MKLGLSMTNLQPWLRQTAGSPSRPVRLALVVTLLVVVSGCAGEWQQVGEQPNVLAGRGPQADAINSLWWLMFALGALVFVIVLGLLLYSLITHRRTLHTVSDVIRAPQGNRWVLMGGIVLPAVILPVVTVYSIYTSTLVTGAPDSSELIIEVYGRRWWWEVHYPGTGAVTANEIHVPVGTPVRFILESTDVIHSFWVPQIQGKVDLIPGQTNELIAQVDTPGVYRGQCAEFCGRQHARMGLLVVAQPQEDFDAWLANQQADAVQADDNSTAEGRATFLAAGCNYCHTIRGFNEGNNLGPDLTHFGSRLTLGAATRENNRGNLGGWIVDSQHIKPGNVMPSFSLQPGELHALLDYLHSLE